MANKGKKNSNKLLESKEGYNLYAAQYNNDVVYLNTFEENKVLEFMGNLTNKTALDLGCGTGRLIQDLLNSGADVTAIDVSEEMINIAKNKFPKIKTEIADVNKLPFKDGSFDFVVASFLIVHLRDLTTTFDEVYRILKDGGEFVLTNINQRKAPKLELKNGNTIVIQSYYHRPEDVIKALEHSFFKIKKEEFIREGKTWINQIIKAVK